MFSGEWWRTLPFIVFVIGVAKFTWLKIALFVASPIRLSMSPFWHSFSLGDLDKDTHISLDKYYNISGSWRPSERGICLSACFSPGDPTCTRAPPSLMSPHTCLAITPVDNCSGPMTDATLTSFCRSRLCNVERASRPCIAGPQK